jgi:hypothetical protein
VEAAPTPWRPLGRLLVEQGLLTEEELERALEQQSATGKRLGETIVELGFVSHPALSRALAEQYGIELKAESGFGTGLRAKIEGHHERKRIAFGVPRLRLVDPDPAEVEEQRSEADVLTEDEALHLGELEEQWAKLAAAEELLAETQQELEVWRGAASRRRDQVQRLFALIQRREQRLAAEAAAAREGDRRELDDLRRSVERRGDQARRVLALIRRREQKLLDAVEAARGEHEEELGRLRKAYEDLVEDRVAE